MYILDNNSKMLLLINIYSQTPYDCMIVGFCVTLTDCLWE